MLAKLNKISLTILVLTFTTKIVNACSLDTSANQPDPFEIGNFYNGLFFIGSIFLLLQIIVFHFLRKSRSKLLILSGIFCFVFTFIITWGFMMLDSCGVLDVTKYFALGFVTLLVLTIVQIYGWYKQRNVSKFELL